MPSPRRRSISRSSSGRGGTTVCTRSPPSCSGSTSATASSSTAADGLAVEGFPGTRSSARALKRLAAEAGSRARLARAHREGDPRRGRPGRRERRRRGGARLANAALPEPLSPSGLHALAAALGADVPFFLEPGPKLAEGAGERLTPLELPQDFWVLVALPRELEKGSTGEVYSRFDELGGGPGFRGSEGRRCASRSPGSAGRSDLAALPPNDLAEAAGAASLAARASRCRRVSRRRERGRAGRLRPLRDAPGGPRGGAPNGPSGTVLGRCTRLVTSPA